MTCAIHSGFEIEVPVLGPVRVVERERHLDQLLAKQVDSVEALLERCQDFLEAHFAVRRCRRIVDLQAPDLERCAVILGVEKERVHSG
jgi:hypothetical protein